MTTAVLISGEMRTFAQCYPTQRWQVFRHYEPDIHFFVSCVDDPQANDASILLRDYEHVHFERYVDPIDLPTIPIEKGAHAPYANATTHAKLMLQHWGNKRVWDFFCRHWDRMLQADPWVKFETIIRIRPDQWIHRFQKPSQPSNNECFCPWWGKFGGINDRLAIIGNGVGFPSAAYHYFGTFDRIEELLGDGCPFHPESLVAEAMRSRYINVRNTLLAEFSTKRMDGSTRWPEISVSDVAELMMTTNRP